MSDIIQGFLPVYDAGSKLLILGSFPSVKSREVSFYYGNRQNKFWKMLAAFFGQPVGESADERRAYVLAHEIALWDIVTECEITGSSDAAIRNYKTADIGLVLSGADIRLILCNGKKSYEIFSEKFSGCGVPYRLMPSTSPANPRYSEAAWHDALRSVFPRFEG